MGWVKWLTMNADRTLSETKLLFLLSRVSLDDGVMAEAQALIDAGADWDSLTSLAIKHGTINFIYKNLLKLRAPIEMESKNDFIPACPESVLKTRGMDFTGMTDSIPQNVMEKFKTIYYQTLRSNILQAAELERILEGMEQQGLEAIVLKGPITSEKIFGDLGIYPSSDSDILVKVEDIDQTKAFLETRGYRLNDKSFSEHKDFFIKELYHISLSNAQFTIEPHWNLFYRNFTTPPEFWWEESISISSNGRNYRFLSPEKNILYTAFRLFSKNYEQLRYLVMVAEIVRHYKEEVDWDKLFLNAKRFHFVNVLKVTLNLCRELLGTPVDERFCEIKGVRARILYQFVRSMVLNGSDFNPVRKILLSFLRDDLSGACKVLLRRLFPSMGEIVSRYRLPAGSNRALLYYFLNPILVLSRRHQQLKY